MDIKMKFIDADFIFFQIVVIADFEFEGKTYKDVKQINNDSILTPEKWEQYKDIFFEQRMTRYNESYTISEKLKLELETLEKLPINKTDYQILKERYKEYLGQKQASPKQEKKTSYVWQNNPDKELPELYSLMINKYKLIALETTYEQFKAVFTGQPIESINPIKWHQDNASELLYFNEAIKNKVNNVWHIYQRLAACFVKPDGKQFNAVWKSLKTNIEINLSPDKQKAIDELVRNF